MELLQLKYFQTIAQEEHMTRAANKLHVSQPSLSKTIKRLEEELGVELFHRSGKNISLNQNGRIFLRHVNTALWALSDAKKELLSSNSDAYPDICLNIDAGIDSLTQIIYQFNQLYPNIHFLLRKENTHANYSTKKYDLALIMLPIEQELPKCSLTLFEEDLMLAVAPSHPLANQVYVNLANLKDEKYISFQASSDYRKTVEHYCHVAGFQPNVVAECHDWYTLCDFVKIKIGISIVPKISWRSHYDDLRLLPIRTPRCARKIVLTWFDDSYVSSSSKLFIEFIMDYFNSGHNL